MQFTVDAKTIKNTLMTSKKVADKGSTLDVLSDVLIRVQDGAATVTVTDLDVTLQRELPTTGNLEEGEVVVDLPSLYKGVRKLKKYADDLTFSHDADADGKPRLCVEEVAGDGASFEYLGEEREGYFPDFTEPFATPVDLDDDFGEMCDRMAPYISDDDARKNLGGLYLDADNGMLAATDGYRMRIHPSVATADLDESAIVRKKAIRVAGYVTTTRGAGEGWQYGRDDEQVCLRGPEGWTLTSRIIEGTFPDLTHIIPRHTGDQRIYTDVETVEKAVDVVGSTASNKTRAVSLRPGDGTCEMYGSDPDVGESTMVLGEHEGDETKIALDYKYLDETADEYDEGQLVMEATGSLSPVRIYDPNSPHGRESFAIIMPKRL